MLVRTGRIDGVWRGPVGAWPASGGYGTYGGTTLDSKRDFRVFWFSINTQVLVNLFPDISITKNIKFFFYKTEKSIAIKNYFKTPFKCKNSCQRPERLWDILPYNYISTDNEFRFGVPLVIGYVIAGLDPDPLLAFGQEAIVSRSPLACLHHCKHLHLLSEL